MTSQDRVPDAWDDDYEAIADAQPKAPAKISRAERKAQHEQANKQLWQSAENPELFHIAQAQTRGAGNNPTGGAPQQTEFKPALKVLSRKPQQPTAKSDLPNGMQGLNIGSAAADDEDDSEEEARKAQEKDLAERQARAAAAREEKQRKYAEARERLFGSPDPSSDAGGRASPGRGGHAPNGGRTRQRGGGKRRPEGQPRGSQPSSSADQSPARAPAAAGRQLYDPNEPVKPPVSAIEKRAEKAEAPIRNPRGPDGSGRGGFGFAPRGGQSSGS